MDQAILKTFRRLIPIKTRKYLLSTFFLVFTGHLIYAGDQPFPDPPLQFEVIYETLHPLKIKKATLYISPDKILGRADSIKMRLCSDSTFQDTLYLFNSLKYPVRAKIKINFADRQYISNKFYLDPQHRKWQIYVSDTAAYVKIKHKFSFEDKNSNLGMVLFIQMLIELILAALIVRFFRWPAWVVLVILVSNLAAYPILLMKLSPSYLGDLLMLSIKFLVIFLTGRKRLGTTRILILVITLPLISYGIKEILIFASKLI